jgi:PAS domain S-box-containing protein
MVDPTITNTDQYHILIVDDAPESLALLGITLKESGFKVRPASNGRHALKSVAARLPDLILLDVNMSDMDGYEVCRRLKADEKSRHVPVIFISAHGETANKVEGFKAGGIDFITKPFEREEVLARVEIHLRLHELTDKLEQQVDRRTRQLQQEIADRKRTEEILREKDYIIESASSVIATCDLDGTMTYVNPAFLKTWGFESVHDIYGRPFWEFWMIDNRLDGIMTALRSNKIWSDEIEAKKKDGTTFHVHLLAAMVFNKAEEPVGLMSTSVDITKRKQVDMFLKMRVTLMQYAASHTLQELLVKTLDEVETVTQSLISFYHFVNPDQKELSLQAWSKRTVSQFCTAKGKGLHYSLDKAGVWVECVHQRRPVTHNDYEALPHRKGMPDGHPQVTRELVVPVFRGEKIVAILGIGNKPIDYTENDIEIATYCADIAWDIAERKLAVDKLRESEARYRSIFENAVEGIFQATPGAKGRFISANPAHARILGYDSPVQLMAEATEIGPRFWIDPNERKAFSEQVAKGAVTGFEVQLRRRDGRLIWVSLNARPVFDLSGKLDYIEGIMLDITDQKRAEEEIRQFNMELEQRVQDRTTELEVANQELEAFAYSVSHDLRAPLRHMDGFVGLLRKNSAKKLDEQGEHYMTTIADAAKRMGALIDDLLSFSRMGRGTIKTKPVDLGVLVREAIKECEPDAHGRSVNWHVTALPRVMGDRAMLRIVFVNLLSNALKFTRSRQQAEIEIGWMTDQQGAAVIFVRDNGVGFEMAYADKLFGVFQRLHRSDEFEGTGIGLANVRRIITRHGGRIWAQGELELGATFYFTLLRA